MANLPIRNPHIFTELLRMLEISDPAHANTFNPLFQTLINNDVFLKAILDQVREGTLNISKLETISKTIEGAINELKRKDDTLSTQMADVVKFKSISIPTTSWIDNTATTGYFYAQITDAIITSSTVINFAVKLADLDKAKKMINVCESFNGYYRFYAKEKPIGAIAIDLQILKQAGVV